MPMSSTLLLFIHGFQGSRNSFHHFPQDIQSQMAVPADVAFYEYNTQGEFATKVQDLATYILALAHTKVIVFCHSMGGPLCVDACLLAPVHAVLAFDSPFFGLGPGAMIHGAARTRAAVQNITKAATELKTYPWQVAGIAALAIGAFSMYTAAATPKAIPNLFEANIKMVKEQVEFLGPLWASDSPARFTRLAQTPVIFNAIYLQLNGQHFAKPPPPELAGMFSTHVMTKPVDCIHAHMELFSERSDPAYLTLLSKTCRWLDSVLGWFNSSC